MEWFLAHAWLTATVTNPTSEQSPDGLAANATTYGLGNLGASWVGDEGDDVLECDVATSAIDPSTGVFALVCDAGDDAVITLRRGTIASPGDLVCTFAKCSPANVWVGFSAVSTLTSSWYLRIDDSAASDPSDPVAREVAFFGVAPRVVLFGSSVVTGRPGQAGSLADLSTHTPSQLGADFASEQVTQFTQTFAVTGHEDDAGLDRLWAAMLACKTVRPVLSCLDKDRATSRRQTVLGRFTALPPEPAEPGMMVAFSVSVVEMM